MVLHYVKMAGWTCCAVGLQSRSWSVIPQGWRSCSLGECCCSCSCSCSCSWQTRAALTHPLHAGESQLWLVFSILYTGIYSNQSVFSLSAPVMGQWGIDGCCCSMHYQPVCMRLWKQHIKRHPSFSLHIKFGSGLLVSDASRWPTLMVKETPSKLNTYMDTFFCFFVMGVEWES